MLHSGLLSVLRYLRASRAYERLVPLVSFTSLCNLAPRARLSRIKEELVPKIMTPRTDLFGTLVRAQAFSQTLIPACKSKIDDEF